MLSELEEYVDMHHLSCCELSELAVLVWELVWDEEAYVDVVLE